MKKSSGPRRAAIVLALVAVAVAAALALAACGSSTKDQNVPEAASSNSDLSSWTDALTTNGLDATLNGAGPFTVFAVTNKGMDAAGAGKVTADVQKAMIIEGTAFAKADLEKGAKNASMLDGNDVVTYTGSDGKFYMNSMEVVGDPIEAKNGIIYMVDGVVTPK